MLGLDEFCMDDGLNHRDAQLVFSTRQVAGDRRCISSLAARGTRSSGYPAPLVDASASARLRLRHVSLSRRRPVRLCRVPWRGLSRCRRAACGWAGLAGIRAADGWPCGPLMGAWSGLACSHQGFRCRGLRSRPWRLPVPETTPQAPSWMADHGSPWGRQTATPPRPER